MLSKDKVLEIAENYLKEIEEESEIELSIVYESTIYKEYGDIFFYTKKKYYETKDERYNTLAGNAPFLVEKKTGKIIEFGTSFSLEAYIKAYETGEWPRK
jgi:predicted oxidoreductase (fatty acid repression mutant protein)